MKKLILTAILYWFVSNAWAQNPVTLQDSISRYFTEIEVAAKKKYKLWNKDLSGQILLVNPRNRQVFSDEPDTAGILTPDQNIYSGILPNDVIIANTSIEWNGKRWGMIMLPLPQNKHDRINLLAHELFHKVQPSLGFKLYSPQNNHLNQKEGRIYLRLELEALKEAIQSSSKKDMNTHLTNAFNFRKLRHSLHSGVQLTENQLELNEGIAEYTGIIVSNRNKKETAAYLINGINKFLISPTYVRSFAYYTTPVYGYLLAQKKPKWNKDISTETDLTDYFLNAFNLNASEAMIELASKNLADYYNAKTVIQEETELEEKTKKKTAEYENKFITQPHFEIKFEEMNFSFDPRNIFPLGEKGTVYPTAKITDTWGVLTIKSGALISSEWDKISVSHPVKMSEKEIQGDGWVLELKKNYTIGKDEATGNYILLKNE